MTDVRCSLKGADESRRRGSRSVTVYKIAVA